MWEHRPYRDLAHLIDFAEESVLEQSVFNQHDLMAIINAHPRLGAPKTQLSAISLKEQGYQSAQPTVSDKEQEEEINIQLQAINDQYEHIYGFKLVEFVNGRSRRDLIPVLEAHVASGATRDQELRRGLKAMMDIAHDRLKKLTDTSH